MPAVCFDGETAALLDPRALIVRLVRARVVIVGESHDQLAHHQMQAWVVQALRASGRPVLLALEMLPWTQTDGIDAWVNTDRDAGLFVGVTDWSTSWGFPAELYADVFERMRDDGVRPMGANAPAGASRAVFRGGLDGLPDALRTGSPASLGEVTPAHRAYLVEALRAHMPAPEAGASADERAMATDMETRFVTAQSIWDASMAGMLVAAHESLPPESALVLLAGNGHVQRGWGVPERVAEVAPVLTIVLQETAPDPAAELLADVVCVPLDPGR